VSAKIPAAKIGPKKLPNSPKKRLQSACVNNRVDEDAASRIPAVIENLPDNQKNFMNKSEGKNVIIETASKFVAKNSVIKPSSSHSQNNKKTSPPFLNGNETKEIKASQVNLSEMIVEEEKVRKEENLQRKRNTIIARPDPIVKYNTISFEIPKLGSFMPNEEKENDQTLLLSYLEQFNPSLAHRYAQLPAYLHPKYFKQV
jgi:hypothetical protein